MVKERDWVVVGATPELLKSQGFQQVGKDFPVFIHPESGEEYALARTERKLGHGYHGFECHSEPTVTLEEDLKRRDLTVNAMAMDEHGKLIDPFGGAEDLKQKQLRHVSNAFTEDPVRVLRLARFAARYHDLGFRVARETQVLLIQMVRDGELEHLVPDRVWQELNRALAESAPEIFIKILRKCGALSILFPEIDALFGVPATVKWHPEVDTGVHLLMCLKAIASLSQDVTVRFAVLMHDLGKAKTPITDWPSHHGHEKRGLSLVKAFCHRYPVPNAHQALALLVAQYHGHIHRVKELKPSTVLKVLEAIDVFRKPERLEQVTLACMADAKGRLGLQDTGYPQKQIWQSYFEVSQSIDKKAIIEAGYEGAELGKQIREARLKAIKSHTPKILDAFS